MQTSKTHYSVRHIAWCILASHFYSVGFADDGTSNLMQSFYRCHAAATLTTKAEALLQAQLDFLLNKEYHDFIPGDTEDAALAKVPQTAYDQKWQERFNAIHDQLASIGREYSALVKKEPRTNV